MLRSMGSDSHMVLAKVTLCQESKALQIEIYTLQNWSLEVPQEPSSRPQLQFSMKFLDLWVRDFCPVLGWCLAVIGRAQLPAPALDKNRAVQLSRDVHKHLCLTDEVHLQSS